MSKEKEKKPYRHINLFKAKKTAVEKPYDELLNDEHTVHSYELDPTIGFEGMFYAKATSLRKPGWSDFVDEVTGTEVAEIGNKSSSAVLFVRSDDDLYAVTFGYGRYLLDIFLFEYDFGIKTALNTLNHEGLRSVDTHTIEDQPVQKKSQAARESDASVFGIDISKDILRSVTGSPKVGVNLKNISGGDGMYSFGIEMVPEDLSEILKTISAYYLNDDYKSEFSWVDNVRRLKVKARIEELDSCLLEAISEKDPSVVITLPEIEKWDRILGFSFTRSKKDLSPTITTESYFDNFPSENISVDLIKRDRLFFFDVDDNEFSHQIYKCLYWEKTEGEKTNVFFGGMWYEIDNSFMSRINAILENIDTSELAFPDIKTWEDDGKKRNRDGR
jgi:uncharacterized protein (TIGR04141 family)